jgi:predicted HTH domain antitoxin
MTLSIPDEILAQAGLSERDALTELACRLYDADKLDFNTAARLGGLSRVELERELLARKLAIVHYSEDDFRQDRETIAHLGSAKPGSGRREP